MELVGPAKAKNALFALFGGEILPSGCTQVSSNIYSIEGVAVEKLESMLRTSYVLGNSGHG